MVVSRGPSQYHAPIAVDAVKTQRDCIGLRKLTFSKMCGYCFYSEQTPHAAGEILRQCHDNTATLCHGNMLRRDGVM